MMGIRNWLARGWLAQPRRSVPSLAATAALLVATVVIASGRLPLMEPDSPGGKAMVRRLMPDQYRQIITDVFGADIKLGGRFEPDVRYNGLLALGSSRVSLTGTGLEQFDVMARTIARQVVDERHRDALVGCRPADPARPDEACARQFIQRAGRLLYRRPLTAEEADRRVKAAGTAAETLGSFYDGLGLSLAGMLESPQFLFRREVAEPDPGHPGKWRLDAWSTASRLSFFLWNSAPDGALLAAAESGELQTREGLSRQVERLPASSRLENGVRAFFADMLEFDRFGTLAKDPAIYPKFTSQAALDAQEQTLRTIVDQLLVRQDDYRDLFTTRRTFLTPMLGTIYGVPVAKTTANGAVDAWVPYEYPAGDPRAGLLMQVSFVALHSHPGRTSPTLRGKALREILLCQKVPDPPGNVNFTVVQDTSNPVYKTARARLSAHATDASCTGCHKVIDPMGLAMENFDSAGGYRTQENGEAIDASGVLDGIDFKDAAGLGRAVHDNPSTPSCLVDRVYAYAAGRPAAKEEADWVAYLKSRFAAEGYRLPALLRRIAMSAAFTRVTAPEPAAATVASAAAVQEGAR
jgi:hypothetical protein